MKGSWQRANNRLHKDSGQKAALTCEPERSTANNKMKVQNTHERTVSSPIQPVGELLNSLSAPRDRLWPSESWPPMRFDRPLGEGARGGHGPIRYQVTQFEPGRRVRFEFTGPPGFDGFHEFQLISRSPEETIIRHAIRMKANGQALFTWPVIFRPLHDSLIEDAFNKAERQLGLSAGKSDWSGWVRILRLLLKKRTRRTSA